MANPSLNPQTPSDPDEGLSSEEESQTSPAPPPALDVPIPTPGTVYPTWDALRHAINAWSLRDKFLSRCVKKDSTRAVYVCRYNETGCEWRVRAIASRDQPGQVVVSNTCQLHTCNPQIDETAAEQALLAGRKKRKYTKRGVQFTQRWVKDAILRSGIVLTASTGATDIVQIIAQTTGEQVSEVLASKAKMSLLHARGDAPTQPLAKIDRRSLYAMQRRQKKNAERAAQAGHVVPAVEPHQPAASPPPPNPMVTDAENRPFVFESGYRVIGPLNLDDQSNEYSMLPQPLEDETLGGPSTSPTTHRRPCPTCSGTGMVHEAPNANDLIETAGVANGTSDELTLLQQQISLISKQISLMQRRKTLQNV